MIKTIIDNSSLGICHLIHRCDSPLAIFILSNSQPWAWLMDLGLYSLLKLDQSELFCLKFLIRILFLSFQLMEGLRIKKEKKKAKELWESHIPLFIQGGRESKSVEREIISRWSERNFQFLICLFLTTGCPRERGVWE